MVTQISRYEFLQKIAAASTQRILPSWGGVDKEETKWEGRGRWVSGKKELSTG